MAKKESAEKAVRDIRRRTRRRFFAEEKIRTVIESLRGEESIASLWRGEGIAASMETSIPLLREVSRNQVSEETPVRRTGPRDTAKRLKHNQGTVYQRGRPIP